jgi:hypothetical protein
MKRRQGASAAEKKAREHPPREKKHEKQRRSAVKTVKPQDSHTVHRVLMSTLYIYIYNSFSLLVMKVKQHENTILLVC